MTSDMTSETMSKITILFLAILQCMFRIVPRYNITSDGSWGKCIK